MSSTGVGILSTFSVTWTTLTSTAIVLAITNDSFFVLALCVWNDLIIVFYTILSRFVGGELSPIFVSSTFAVYSYRCVPLPRAIASYILGGAIDRDATPATVDAVGGAATDGALHALFFEQHFLFY